MVDSCGHVTTRSKKEEMSVWWPGEWDRLITKVEDWVLKKHGYSKLQSRRISKGCQSMVAKPKNDPVCITFRFPSADTFQRRCYNNRKNTETYMNYQLENESIQLKRRTNSLEILLQQYERAFARLQKHGPNYAHRIQNRNLDILNEDVIQNMFHKCYSMKRIESEIPASRV